MKSFALSLAAGAAYALDSNSHYQYKTYTPAPKQYGHSCAAPYYCSPNNYHSPNHSHDPFSFSRAQIPYVATKLAAPVYASCYMNCAA